MKNQVKKEEESNSHPQYDQEIKNIFQDFVEKSAEVKVKEEHEEPRISDLVLNQQGASWLYHISIMNKIPFYDLLNWSSRLLSCLKHFPFQGREPMIKLAFQVFQSKQQYFCFLIPIEDSFAVVKVRNRQGSLFYYKQIEVQNIGKEIYLLVKKMPTTSHLLIFDQISPDNSLAETMSELVSNGAYIHLSIEENIPIDVKSNFVYKNVKNYMVMCPKKIIKKIGSLETVIDIFIETELKERNNLLINQFGSAVLRCKDYVALISHLLEKSKARSRQEAREYVIMKLEIGTSFLNEMIKRYESNRQNHYPSKGQEKKVCAKCNKRKTGVVCQTCSYLNGNETRLCVGSCFSEYHTSLFKISQNPKHETCRSISFFDGKMQEIFKIMTQLSEDEENHQLLGKFINYVNWKTVRQLNDLAQEKLEEEDEE